MSNSVSKMSYYTLNNLVPISLFQGVSGIAEYFRWSRYGRLVIVDIGGIALTSIGTILTESNSPLPIMRTRPVAKLINDQDTTKGATIYGTLNAKDLQITAGASLNVRLYGTLIYLTDEI